MQWMALLIDMSDLIFKWKSNQTWTLTILICNQYHTPLRWSRYTGYSHITWASWHHKSPTHWLFVHSLLKPGNKSQSAALLTLCEGNPAETVGFPSQSAGNAESVSCSLRHYTMNLSDFLLIEHHPYQHVFNLRLFCIGRDISTSL